MEQTLHSNGLRLVSGEKSRFNWTRLIGRPQKDIRTMPPLLTTAHNKESSVVTHGAGKRSASNKPLCMANPFCNGIGQIVAPWLRRDAHAVTWTLS